MQNVLRKLQPNRLFKLQKLFTIPVTQIQVNLFHQSSRHDFKTFIDRENLHAYEIIKCPNIVQTVNTKLDLNLESMLLETNWEALSPTELTENFVKVAELSLQNDMCISDKIFDKLIDAIIRKCRQLTDDDIFRLLAALKKWPETESINSNNFGDLWSALDDMCLERYRQWNHDKLFKSAELWYNLNLGKVSEYFRECVDRIGRNPNQLTTRQIVELMFYVNILRRPLTNMIDFEYRIARIVDELSVDELAVICMAFFKTQTTIKDSRILAEMVRKVRENVDTIHEISLCAILKLIRFSRHLNIVDQINCMLDDLVEQIDRLSLLCCIHIGLIGTICHNFHEPTILRISNKFYENIKSARLKDIERVVFITTLYDYDPKCRGDFYEAIIEELRTRGAEIDKYPRCLISSVHYLSLRELYPVDLIRRILNPEFLTYTYEKNLIGREVFNLDTCLKIDLPNYNGDCLTEQQRAVLSKRYTKWPPKAGRSMPLTDKIMLEVIDSLVDVFGGQRFIEINHVLPHFERADIIFGLKRKDRLPIDMTNLLGKYTLGDVKSPPGVGEPIDWCAMVIGGWNHFIRDTTRPTGPIKTKIQQLEKIGYRPLLVHWADWKASPSADLRARYLRKLIQQHCS